MNFIFFYWIKIKIRKYLVQNLKTKNNPIYYLEELNSSFYFKYEDLSKELVQEITNDSNLSLNFGNILKNIKNIINFNETFK